MKYQHVFWDWNGTLLDDLEYAIGVRNRVFPRFKLPGIQSLSEYYAQFTFPVRLYYKRAGVTEENFTRVAHAWMDEYVAGMGTIPLHEDALYALKTLREAGVSQTILSASSIPVLTAQIAQYGIESYFETVLGLSHIYATSKEAIGEKHLRDTGINPRASVLLGDTLHDAQVARALSLDCILIDQGHQRRETLLEAGCPVCSSLREAVALVVESTTAQG